ncbi:MAG TPA: 50S ribosomal protein L11 methyltransferase [Candidatus Polarisedimenticolia bacterium]|jgi:ribosomal protein L11 methyltransferase
MLSWRRLTFTIPDTSAEDLLVCLHEQGTLGVEAAEGRLHAWFMEPLDEAALLLRLRQALGAAADPLRLIQSIEVPDGFWHERWLEGLTPLPVGKSFLVVPGPADATGTTGRRVIRLTPGRAFGTGEHPTTRMCLELIEERITPGQGLLDVGTGSGILAIAARMLGADPVVALDIDPVAVGVAACNAAANGVAGVLLAAGGIQMLRAGRSFERVVANLNGVTLVRLMGELAPLASREMILSGIMAEEQDDVTRSASCLGFTVAARLVEAAWVAVAMRRAIP